MFVIVWENARGQMCQSEKMDKTTANVFLLSLLPEQDGRMFYVKTN
jgi:hypothetical protein